jgi:hypothetical protein
MKTILRIGALFAILFLTTRQLQAQCTVSNVIIQNVSVSGTQTPGTCTVTFDASFTIENNNGNKFIFIHVWTMDDYPNYFRCVNGQTTVNGAVRAPDASVLADAFLNIGINNNEATPSIIMDYPPASGVTMTNVGSISREVLPDGSAVFILTGITATVPVTCGTPVVLMADLWSSQSARAQVAHCVNCGLGYSAGFMGAAGLVNCASLTYNITLTNNTGTTINGYYRLYADINGDGYFTPAIDTLLRDTTAFSISAGIGMTTLLTGGVPSANLNQDVFILITQTSGQASGTSRVALIQSTQCATLPVTFNLFRATRINRSAVSLRWETATEINNSGFIIQRNTAGDSEWERVTFIPSLAQDGNSNSMLSYTFTDVNSHKGITQYRIRQMDLDGKSKLSEIRAVRGEGQVGAVIVYPVPSYDGRVNVVFDDLETTRDVVLYDMNGRMIRQWKAITNNTFQADNLRPGIYALRIQDVRTGDVQVEKIVVSANH